MSEATWPDGRRAGAVVTIELGAESIDRAARPHGPLSGRHSHGRYGAQVAVPSLLALLADLEVRATFFVAGWEADRDPELVAAIATAGHEVAGYGYLHEDLSQLSAAEQERVLERSEAAIERAAGIRPAGWRAPHGLMGATTRTLLADRGYRYDSSYCDDHMPYLAADRPGLPPIVELPVFAAMSDAHYYRLCRPASVVTEAWAQELRAMCAVGGLINLCLSPHGDHGSGRPARLAAVAVFVRALCDAPEVWCVRCIDVADALLAKQGEQRR